MADPLTWAIAGSSLLGGIGSIFGASEQSDAASDAARAQTQAANRSIDLQERIYDDQRQLHQPFYQAGLRGLYGDSGAMALLGHTQPGGGGGQRQNAFSDYASGTYGTTTPAQQEESIWAGYLSANPDIMRHYSNNNIANSPHLLGGGGAGTDLNRDGTISPEEFAQYHYQNYGQAEGRSFGEPQNAFAGGSNPPPNIVADGNGGYRQGGESQLAVAGPAPSQPIGKEVAPSEGPQTAALRATPGYQFLQDESKRQLENSFASRGKLLSGAAMDALNTRTLGLADQTYQQSVNNNFNLANLGMGSAAQISNAGTNFGNAASNAFYNQGQAAANGAIGQANAFSNGLQGVSDSIFGGIGLYGGSQGWF